MKIIRTARLNQVDSEKYIAYVLTQLGKTGQEDIGRLLPWSESLPEEAKPSKYEVQKSAVDSIKKDKYQSKENEITEKAAGVPCSHRRGKQANLGSFPFRT